MAIEERLGRDRFVVGLRDMRLSELLCRNARLTLKEEYTIHLKHDVVPFSLSAPRRIPIPLREVVRKMLEKLESDGVIRRIDNPTPWCSGLVVVPKPSGAYRLCVDLTRLICAVLRERHILPTVEQVLGLLGDVTVFSKLDATASFHQVKLSATSQEATAFVTPLRRYCFCGLPNLLLCLNEHTCFGTAFATRARCWGGAYV